MKSASVIHRGVHRPAVRDFDHACVGCRLADAARSGIPRDLHLGHEIGCTALKGHGDVAHADVRNYEEVDCRLAPITRLRPARSSSRNRIDVVHTVFRDFDSESAYWTAVVTIGFRTGADMGQVGNKQDPRQKRPSASEHHEWKPNTASTGGSGRPPRDRDMRRGSRTLRGGRVLSANRGAQNTKQRFGLRHHVFIKVPPEVPADVARFGDRHLIVALKVRSGDARIR